MFRAVSIGLLGVLTLAALALPALAEANRNVYVSNGSFFDNLSAFSISGSGSLALLGSSPFEAGDDPYGLAATPDGTHLYVANGESDDVSAYSIAANGSLTEVTGSPFAAGTGPYGVAAAPDGNHLYVTNGTSEDVSAYEIAADGSLTEVAGSPFAAGNLPSGVAASPDGKHLYVINQVDAVSAFDIAADGSLTEITGSPFTTAFGPSSAAVSPDGKHLYVISAYGTVSAHKIAADGSLTLVAGSPFAAERAPFGVAVSPDGKHLYVASRGMTGTVSAYDIAANGSLAQVTGSPFAAEVYSTGVAATPDGKHLYVTDTFTGNVSAFDIAVNGGLTQVAGSPFPTGAEDAEVQSIAITPNQPPIASFTNGTAEAGSRTSFDASASTDPDGSVATYDWDFGDGKTKPNGGPTPAHTYRKAGDYDVIVTLTDNEGCSTAIVYTGQTTSCNGSAVAEQTRTVEVAKDKTGPKTKITKKPKSKVKTKKKKAKAKVSFSSEKGAKFKCRLDKASYKFCTSPYKVKAKSGPGKGQEHMISIKATDSAGNVGKAATVKFKAIRKR